MTRLCVWCAAVAVLLLASATGAEVHTIHATGEYRMGDNDTRTDAKRLALLDAKRLAMEQVGTYVESISEVRDMRLTRDEIHAYTAGIVEVKDAKTRAELDKDGQSTIIYADVVCEVDSEVLARQMENLRRNESASRELNALRAENERLRALVEEQSHALAQVRTQAEQERLAGQRQETLKNIDVNELLTQAWVALAGPESPVMTVGSSSLSGREEARHLITRALTIDPRSAEARTSMGGVLQEEGDFDGAINEYRQALRIKPDLVEAHIGLGNTLGVKGDFDGAIGEFHQAIRIKPDDVIAHYN
ncbi:tetratricopeptide repeat protein, partial [bacterium]|nr:tetratricopeptide repeat protein [bacterium]